ncbi:hypothetical protein DNTS_018075 [Danionella cerebrum]|uniref:Neuritin-like protein n=1 Tax=Danionella cerebrum TaxID=2873325 RepID=A0A553QGU9_9TELE|nr:hypothetical protein DNTS_018075 [Danionella translucida]
MGLPLHEPGVLKIEMQELQWISSYCCMQLDVPSDILVSSYWDDFHSCAITALADCQEGATEQWENLKKESRNLGIRGSLFQLCPGGNGATLSTLPLSVTLVLTALSPIVTWIQF